MSVLTNNYEIIRELGRGGMGAVYLAYDKRLDRQVAIKMVHVDPSVDEATSSEIIQRFQKEARAIAKLNHPNIVSIYDIGEDKHQYYMVIELLEGQSLSNIVEKKQKLPYELVISAGVQICAALSYAHKHGIVHRDIKPANIMFSQDHLAKLTDFGIAQLGNDKMGLTQQGTILGSILYIPPEQLIDARKVDQRADIYSLGATLYQLITRKLPFEGDTVAKVITKILNEELPPMRSLDPSVPEVLDKVIMKAMKKEPDDRYAEAADFGKALSEVGEFLKNPDYIIDPVHLGDPAVNISKTKPENLNSTQIIPDLKKDTIKNMAAGKTEVLPKKNLSTQKISTGALKKATSGKAKSKNKALPLIGGALAGVVALVVILISVFGHGKHEESKPESPANYQTNTATTVKPVRKVIPRRFHRQQVVRPRALHPKRVEPRIVSRTVIKPAIKKPVVQVGRSRAAAPVVQRKAAAARRPARPVTSAKKSIGEGY